MRGIAVCAKTNGESIGNEIRATREPESRLRFNRGAKDSAKKVFRD